MCGPQLGGSGSMDQGLYGPLITCMECGLEIPMDDMRVRIWQRSGRAQDGAGGGVRGLRWTVKYQSWPIGRRVAGSMSASIAMFIAMSFCASEKEGGE